MFHLSVAHPRTKRFRRGRLAVLVLLALLPALLGRAAAPPARPNLVLFVSDDHDLFYTNLGGEQIVRTPNLDRLAQEGMVFTHAFTATAMCAPSRSVLFTGLFPHRNGAHQNHSQVRASIRTLPHYLKELGYRVVLAGKRHIGPEEAFPFEYLSRKELDGFLTAVGDEPFCLVIASVEPHTPHARGGYRPEEVSVAPWLVDTPALRARLADYLTDITLLDAEVGEALALLERHGVLDRSLFLYASDHGAPLPFAKWTLYEAGLRVPFIARWPGRIAAGSRTEAMISFVDVLPTFIELAGGTPPQRLDGRSFRPVLLEGARAHRELIFGAHTNAGINHGGPYPIRSVRTRTHKYILNLTPEWPFTNNVTEGAREFDGLWTSWVERAGRDPEAARRVRHYQHRPAEELYDLRSDPYELHNLASDPAQRAEVARLRRALLDWMAEQQDPLLQIARHTE